MKIFALIPSFLLFIYLAGPPAGLSPVAQQGACTHHVAVTGSDSNSGSMQKPWKTIQKAANSAVAGNVVCVHAGVYSESVKINVSGSASAGYVTFRSFPGEKAVLDGSKLIAAGGWAPLVDIHDGSYIIVQNFEIRNYRTREVDHVPVGIFLSGAGDHIQILGNDIHHIETNVGGEEGGDAHGIAVYGTAAPKGLADIVISGNELHHLKLGSSESLVVNGNVDRWQVTGNKIHDNDNIGIDVIGFEGTAPVDAYDRARNGLISANEIYNIDSYGNPAYGEDRSAGCIYVDGGTRIIIERNTAHHCNIGVELASENRGRSASYITVRNNFIYANTEAGIALGGYDSDRGRAEYCSISNNTLYNNDTSREGNGELLIQYDTRNNIIKNNIFYANDQKLFIGSWSAVMSANIVDFNLYYTQGGGGMWEWKSHTYETFSAYNSATGNDLHSLHQKNPLFASLTGPDLHLQKTSPAVNAGQNIALSGQLDVDAQPRLQGPATDLGADELHQ